MCACSRTRERVEGATLKHDCLSGGIVRNFGGIVRVVTGELWDVSRFKTPWTCTMN
jgi:hypothetical protein